MMAAPGVQDLDAAPVAAAAGGPDPDIAPGAQDRDVEAVGRRLEALLALVADAEPVARSAAERLVGELLALHGEGLERLVGLLVEVAPEAARRLADDPLLTGLLVLHDLHPLDVRERVEAAVARFEGVRVVGVSGEVATLAVAGGCSCCGPALPPEAGAAVRAAAPELASVEVVAPEPALANGLIPASALSTRPLSVALGAEAGRPAHTGPSCELCGAGLDGGHRHLVDLTNRSLACSCRACGLLFDQPGAARGRYLVVPEDYRTVSPFVLTPQQWNALQIPVGLAFFLTTSGRGDDEADPRTVAFYPSPAGATESELMLDAWQEVLAANPPLERVAPDVEAVLVRFRVAEPQCFIVPVDRCYELVGTLRQHWRGFDGGSEVAEHVAAFFEDVAARSRPQRTGTGGGA